MSNESLIAQIDAEIARLQRAKALLVAAGAVTVDKPRRGRPKKSGTATPSVPGKTTKRKMSAEGRARIAQAAKKRWAAVKAKKK